ncbi:prephenate dehydrogenase/arogenate dehydrogenase family protein [bacterium]|nr:prephenate dehydrogenase/arogenate dehydrogenase family protein [bacterium]MCI0604677.1 prephenate dehydrogenase/arogenate dehydrogenase family protein [bacterium]
MKKIAIVGLGQIGGSIVLTLRRKRARYSISGIDSSAKRLRLMKSHLNHAGKNWEAACDADLVIVCLHYQGTVDFLNQASPEQLLMDVCSGKEKLVRLADRRKLRFVGGHPMAGNEFEGEKGWRAGLFENAPFFLCPAKNTSRNDLRIVQELVRDLKARPVTVDPKRHDQSVSVTSHFPAFLAGLLIKMGTKVPDEFRGPGFHSMTRLANTSPQLLNTFLESNHENILHSAKQMKKLLQGWIKKAS